MKSKILELLIDDGSEDKKQNAQITCHKKKT